MGIPRESVPLSSEEVHQKSQQFKIIGKAMELPLVADAVSLTKSTISPLVETMTPVASKLEEQVASFKTRAEESLLPQLSEVVRTSAVEQVSAAVANLDGLACGGLDQLIERVPVLRVSTPEVMETTKEVAASYVGLLTEYLASFTLAQVALKVGEASLSMVDSTLKITGLGDKMPVSIGSVRREARALRRAGIRRSVAESSPAQTIGEVSLLGAVAEIMGVNFFLSAVGLKLVPSNKRVDEVTVTFDMGSDEVLESDAEDEEMTVQQRLGPEKLDAYESDKDPDYSPSEASDDSLEYDSEAEEVAEPVESAVVYEDEHSTVIAEAEVEQEPVVVDTESSASVAEIVDSATLTIGVSTEAEDSPLTPLIDTQGFAAVSSTVAALEAAVVSEKPVTNETTLTQNPVDAFESLKVVVSDVITETECDVTEATEEIEIVDIAEEVEVVEDEGEEIEECNTPKCVKPIHAVFRNEQTEDILTEATEDIEIVDIAEEARVVEDEGEVTEECNTPKCDKPVHAAFRYEQTEDNPILIDDKNDF